MLKKNNSGGTIEAESADHERHVYLKEMVCRFIKKIVLFYQKKKCMLRKFSELNDNEWIHKQFSSFPPQSCIYRH